MKINAAPLRERLLLQFCSAVFLWVGGCAAPKQQCTAHEIVDIPLVEHLDRRKLTGTVSADTSHGRVVATSRYRLYGHARDGEVRYWKGMDGATPVFVLEQITLSIDGADITVPQESYRYCGEEFFQSSMLLVHDAGGKLGLSYNGGDGAGAHRILFIVDGDKISETATFAWRAFPGHKYPVKAWQSEPVSRTAEAEE